MSKEIINKWIDRQNGFFITSNKLICPICNNGVENNVITKRNGWCMPCFISQIVNACEKQRI